MRAPWLLRCCARARVRQTGLSGRVEPQHEDAHLLVAKELCKDRAHCVFTASFLCCAFLALLALAACGCSSLGQCVCVAASCRAWLHSKSHSLTKKVALPALNSPCLAENKYSPRSCYPNGATNSLGVCSSEVLCVFFFFCPSRSCKCYGSTSLLFCLLVDVLLQQQMLLLLLSPRSPSCSRTRWWG